MEINTIAFIRELPTSLKKDSGNFAVRNKEK
jgi:hypothetical protein